MAVDASKTTSHSKVPLTDLDSRLTIQAPLSRRGRGPGLVFLLDETLDLRKHEKTLDHPPLQKWTEESFAVAQLRIPRKFDQDLVRDGLGSAISKLSTMSSWDQSEKVGVIIYMSVVESALLEKIEAYSEICAVIWYGASPAAATTTTEKPLLTHVAGGARDHVEGDGNGNEGADSFFVIPAHKNYSHADASIAHTRTLTFPKPLVSRPYFDLGKIWDEHTY